MKPFQIFVIAGVAVAILGGLFVVGSPWQARLRLFDSDRVNHLSRIQSEIVSYWQAKGSLPGNLDALRDDIRGFAVPVDPMTHMPYEYTVTGPLSFSLCATFNVPSSMREAPVWGGDFGQFYHGAGHECFTRTIDPDRYPPFPGKAVPMVL